MGASERIEPRSLADEALLRGSDDLLVDFDRAFRMFQEFVRGCRALHDVGLAVTVFGSARFDENHRYYPLAREVGRELARRHYAVVTGGVRESWRRRTAARARAAGSASPATSSCRASRSRWDTMFREATAEEGEVSGFLVTDSVIEAADHIERVVRGSG